MKFLLTALALLLITGVARAETGVSWLTRDELETLTRDLVPKVDLFRDAWAQNQNVEFFGGTSRDFLLWVKGRFRPVTNREEALAVSRSLRDLPLISAHEF